MAKNKNNPLERELQAFVGKHPDTEMMELLIADLSGVLRGKRIQEDEFASIFKKGFCIPGGTVLLDSVGDVVPGIPFQADDGDPDVNARIVPGTLAPIPWAKKAAAQALFRLYERSGEPFFADPRSVLERAAAPLRKMNLGIVMAVELEFYLLDANSESPTAKVPLVPGIGRPQPGPQVYSPDDLWDIDDFLNELNEVCRAQHIPAGTTSSEFAPGQFEINLHHTDDPVRACDHAVLLKRAIKAVARRHGAVACFMAKPFEEDAARQKRHKLFFPGQGQDGAAAVQRETPPRDWRARENHGGRDRNLRAQRQFIPAAAPGDVCAGRTELGHESQERRDPYPGCGRT